MVREAGAISMQWTVEPPGLACPPLSLEPPGPWAKDLPSQNSFLHLRRIPGRDGVMGRKGHGVGAWSGAALPAPPSLSLKWFPTAPPTPTCGSSTEKRRREGGGTFHKGEGAGASLQPLWSLHPGQVPSGSCFFWEHRLRALAPPCA